MRMILILSLAVFLSGCSMPVSSIQGSLYSFTKEKKKGKGMLASWSAPTVRDFREEEAYEEDMEGLKEDVEEYISRHPDLKESARNDLRELKVSPGAGSEEVILLLGKPDKLINLRGEGRYGASEIWIYKISKLRTFTVFIFPVFPVHEAYYLYLKDGTLLEIERHALKQTVEQGRGSDVNIKESERNL